VTGLAAWVGLALAGGAGAVLRFAVDSAIGRRSGTPFPLGTFAINTSGSFALGLLTAATVGSTTLFLLGTGLLGSYTTFSTWIFESEQLAADREYALAAANLAGSAVAGVASALAGWAIGAAL
jgi:CrcB protein